MKTSKLLALLIFSIFQIGNAQISIVKSDIGSANDTVRYSYTTSFVAQDYIATDTAYRWDFSQLTPSSQYTDRYDNLNSTSTIYKIAFFGKANLVSPRNDMGMAGILITDVYNFFKKSNSNFRRVGYGGKNNGTPIPIVFNNPDILYTFPMSYGNTDSCNSDWAINVPNTGYLAETLHRVNSVDGWGTIITPYGSFSCIRLKSVVQQEDTLYLANSGAGYKLPQKYIEYTWFAKNMNFPIMQVTVPQSLIGQVQISYMDSIRQFVGITESSKDQSPPLLIFPNPAKDHLKIILNNVQNTSIEIINTQGQQVYYRKIETESTLNINTSSWARGIYFVQYKNAHNSFCKKLILF